MTERTRRSMHSCNNDDVYIYRYWLMLKGHMKLFFIVSAGVFIISMFFANTQPKTFSGKCTIFYKTGGDAQQQQSVAYSYNVLGSLQKKIGKFDVADLRLDFNKDRTVTFTYRDKDRNKAFTGVREWVKKYLANCYYYYPKQKMDIFVLPHIEKTGPGIGLNDIRGLFKNVFILSFIAAIGLGLAAVFAVSEFKDAKKRYLKNNV